MQDLSKTLEELLTGADPDHAVLQNCLSRVAGTMAYGREPLLAALRRNATNSIPTHYAAAEYHAALFATSDERSVALIADHVSGNITRLWYVSSRIFTTPIPMRLDVPFDPHFNESVTAGFDATEHPSLSEAHVERVRATIRTLDLSNQVESVEAETIAMQRVTPCLLRAFSDGTATIALMMMSALRVGTSGIVQFPVAARLTAHADPLIVVDQAGLANETARSWTTRF